MTVLPRLPVLSGTQSAGPAGGDGSGQTSFGLGWYDVLQPFVRAATKALSPEPSQATPVVRLPPCVTRKTTSFGGFCTLRLPVRLMLTLSLCVPAVSE